ncbi:MAG: glycosyltransferase [Nitrososphaeraceae archaeon]|nr:glycosyltransferase [Nitrososphaeraceae archaeon]
MKPHILIIAQYFPPDVAGTSTRAYNAARGLRSQGCRVTVLTAFPHYPHGTIPEKYRRKTCSVEDHEGIRVIRTWVPAISHYTIARRIALHGSFILSSWLTGALRIRNVDVIMSMNPSFFSFFPAFMLKMLYKKDIVHNVDDLWPEVWYDLGIVKSRNFKWVLDWIARHSYRVPVAITPISHSYVHTLTHKYHIQEDKIFVIEHGVDTSRFYRTDNIAARSLEGIIKHDADYKADMTGTIVTTKQPSLAPQGNLTVMPASSKATENCESELNTLILYSGALSIGYDFEPVIKAAKVLNEKRVRFILRGAGTSANDVENLKLMIKQLEVKNVQIKTERLPPEELVNLLNQADIFLLPMSFVGFDMGLPTKVLEYQALGKPIVCISNGEAADYISKTRSGLVSRDRDPDKIAGLILKLVNNKQLATELGNNGYLHIQQNLTLEKIGQRFMTVIGTRCRYRR